MSSDGAGKVKMEITFGRPWDAGISEEGTVVQRDKDGILMRIRGEALEPDDKDEATIRFSYPTTMDPDEVLKALWKVSDTIERMCAREAREVFREQLHLGEYGEPN